MNQDKIENREDSGLDPETSSYVTAPDPAQVLAASLRESAAEPGPIEAAKDTVREETPYVLRSVGSAMGAAVGGAVGGELVKTAMRHATMLSIGVSTVGVALGMTFAFKFVAKSMGVAWAAAAVANIGSAAAIVGFAFMRAKRK